VVQKGRKQIGLELHATPLGFASKVTQIKLKEMSQQSWCIHGKVREGKGREGKGREGKTAAHCLDSWAGSALQGASQHSRAAYQLLSIISEARAHSSVHHIASVFFQNNKVLFWTKESPDFPQISEA